MGDLATALVSTGSAIAGGTITGLFAMWVQGRGRQADEARWEREAAERSRTRFHETRLTVYTEYLSQVADAHSWELSRALDRQRDVQSLGDEWPPTTPVEGHPDYKPDAVRQMLRRKTVVDLLAGSDEIRAAAQQLVEAVVALRDLPPDADAQRWGQRFAIVLNTYAETARQFTDLAHAQLER